jgi:flagellar protein FliS
VQSSTAQDNYVATEVHTATPQKLHLLLIDAALRSAQRARQFREQGRDDRAVASLVHAQEVVGQMLADIKPEVGGDLAARVSSVYEFIFRCLVQAGHRRDEKSLADAIRILEIERETWRQLCDKLAVNAPHAAFHEAQRGIPPLLGSNSDLSSLSGGFSIEA